MLSIENCALAWVNHTILCQGHQMWWDRDFRLVLGPTWPAVQMVLGSCFPDGDKMARV
jgi:hypothetical protein